MLSPKQNFPQCESKYKLKGQSSHVLLLKRLQNFKNGNHRVAAIDQHVYF